MLDRLRANSNIFTRMHYYDVRGRVAFSKRRTRRAAARTLSMVRVPGQPKYTTSNRVRTLVEALGRFAGLGVYAIDTGCV